MSLAVKNNESYPMIVKVKVALNKLTAEMSDGREVSVPLAWFHRLSSATLKQLQNYEISPAGYGIHWPDLDEDISIKAFLN